MLARRSHETILKSCTGPSGEGGGAQLAPATTMTKQKLSFSTLNVKEAGYLFVYLSYDNDSNNCLPAVATAKAGVYFDDFKITHTPTSVIQYNEYYPFGLQTSNSWTREDNVNDYLYNGGSELNGNSGWYETFFRGYDPVLGRFMQVDPMAPALSSFSPYNFALNDPAYYNDPMGDYVQARLPPQTVGKGLADIFGPPGGGGGSLNNWINQYRSSTYIGAGDFINSALNSEYGGSWSGGQAHFFTSDDAAFMNGVNYIESHQAWTNTEYGSIAKSAAIFQYIKEQGVMPSKSEIAGILNSRQSGSLQDLPTSAELHQMYDGPFSRFVADLQNIIYQGGWIGVAGQQSLFDELYHDGYQYSLIPDLQPGQFGWQLGLTSLTVGIGDRNLINRANPLGLIPNNANKYGVTGFSEDYNHRLDYIFIVNDAGGTGGTYVVGLLLSPLIPK